MISSAEIHQLWKQHAAGLALLVRSRFGKSAGCDAEDFVQEAFVRLAGLENCPDDPHAWLARCVRNLAIDNLRATSRRRERERKIAAEQPAWFQPSGGQQLEMDEALNALAELPLEQRETVVAHLWNGLTFRQIAEAFDTSASRSNRLYQAGIKTLRERLSDDEASDPKRNRSPEYQRACETHSGNRDQLNQFVSRES